MLRVCVLGSAHGNGDDGAAAARARVGHAIGHMMGQRQVQRAGVVVLPPPITKSPEPIQSTTEAMVEADSQQQAHAHPPAPQGGT